MKYILNFARLIVGNLFIFSGVVKANDPLGFSYKLEEYFVEFGMDWAWLHDLLVPLAAGLCIVEIILGVAVLVGYKMKEVSWALLLMIIFFTILTGASAIFEIVRSCGCFGDAIPLTPWQSFYKDLVLLVFILIIFFKRSSIKPYEEVKDWGIVAVLSIIILAVLSNMLSWWFMAISMGVVLLIGVVSKLIFSAQKAATITVVASLLCSLYITIWAVEYLPFRDFRPYAVGKNLPEQMTLPEDAVQPVYENILTYKNKATGEVKEFTTDEYTASKIWEDKNWEWQSTESELIVEGDVAKITDLAISTHDGRDITDLVLAENKVLWIVCYDLSLTSEQHLKEINELAVNAADQGINVMALSSAGEELKQQFIDKHNLAFEFFITDGIVLKTMVRSNPGIMYLENGTVKGKWHENQVPNIEEILAL